MKLHSILITFISSFIFFFASPLDAISQSAEETEKLFKEGSFEEAKRGFHDLYYSDMDNDFYKYRLALCYLFTQEEEEAIRLITQVGSLEDQSENLHKIFYLARAYHLDHDFKQAIINYQSYLDTYNASPDVFDPVLEAEVVLPAIYGGSAATLEDPISIEASIKKLIEACEYGIELSVNPTRIAIENAGSPINSERAEYAPVINAAGDELYFTSKVEVEEGEFAERLFYSKMGTKKTWSKPVEIKITEDIFADIAPLYVNPANNLSLIYNSESNNGDIFVIEKINGKWEQVKGFPKSINSKYWEPSASMFPDNNTLVFSSNRPDGFGGLDLYISRKDEKGKWSDPENLGPEINTPFDEDAPFVLYNEPMLYFSSRGHKTVGGYDVFKTRFEDGKWSKPENLKIPINSAYDDIYITWTEDGRRAYFSSHRLGTKGATDIYYMDFNQISLNVFVKKETEKGLEAITNSKVSLERMKTGQMIEVMNEEKDRGLTVFLSNENEMYMLRVDAPGYWKYVESMNLRRGNDFVAFQNKEIILKEDGSPLFEESASVKVKPKATVAPSSYEGIKKSGKTLAIDGKNYQEGDVLKQKVHFILNVSKDITNYSKNQMDQVIEIMKENPGLKIQIIGHADQTGSSEYNEEISRQRELSVKDYFLNKGIDESRLRGTWKGDADPVIDTDKAELLNRRVEFLIVGL